MTLLFSVSATASFERVLQKLAAKHAELADIYAQVLQILETGPYNRSKAHNLKKLTDVDQGAGQWRLRLGRYACCRVTAST